MRPTKSPRPVPTEFKITVFLGAMEFTTRAPTEMLARMTFERAVLRAKHAARAISGVRITSPKGGVIASWEFTTPLVPSAPFTGQVRRVPPQSKHLSTGFQVANSPEALGL